MQLAGIKISNLFSFPYLTDLKKAQEVTFHNFGKSNVNVLIGPNGAGKSKFLEVIKQIFKVGFMKDYVVSKANFESKDPALMQSTIQENPVLLQKVYKHYSYPDMPSEVMVRFILTEHDYDNLRFVCSHVSEINELIRVYSNVDYAFPEMNIDDIVLGDSTIQLHCLFDIAKQSIQISREGFSAQEQFILEYFMHSELIQICIDLHNILHPKTSWPAFHHTFAVIGFERGLANIPLRIRPEAWEGFVFDKNHDAYNAYAGYYLCARKIRGLLSPANKDLDVDEVQKKLGKSEFFTSLTAIVQKYFNKTLRVAYHEGSLEFSFVDVRGFVMTFEDLSDGEQSLMVMILTIYGYDLREGMLIIDEPEIHFHPQMQRSLSRMMERISENIGTQFILSTYSPLFIDESNINHVYRFSKPSGSTQIRNPALSLSDDEASLVHLLKFENMSKIFFVNKIIMVEGETDAYFFDFYLRYLHTFPEWKAKLTDYEIININGKGSYKLWKKFLSKFGITSYFIGDRDNIVDYGFVTQSDLSYYYKQAKAYFPKIKSKLAHGSHYNKLVLTIRDKFTAKYNEFLGRIRELYAQQVYILQKGDIETYINLQEKGLESTVAFCHHYFKKWLADKQFEPHRKEFEDIFGRIFK